MINSFTWSIKPKKINFSTVTQRKSTTKDDRIHGTVPYGVIEIHACEY